MTIIEPRTLFSFGMEVNTMSHQMSREILYRTVLVFIMDKIQINKISKYYRSTQQTKALNLCIILNETCYFNILT